MVLFPTDASAWERRLLIGLLVTFFAVGMLYNVVTPLFEVSDEIWHYHFVRHLALGNPLPVQDAANQGPWRQEGSQPPLYYALAALTTFWVDTSDIDQVARFNPHGDFGVITPDGNVNLVVHNREAEAWPWQKTTLAVHVARLLSILLSTGSVYVTYRIGLELFSDKRWLALAGAGAVAFLPMFVFVSASVNNDNLAVLTSTLGLWLILRLVRDADEETPTLRRALALGLTLGLGALAKVSTLGLFGLAGLTLAYVAYRRKRWQTFIVEGPLLLLVAGLVSGWWYIRNWRLYGDPLGWNAFLDIAGRRADTSAPLARLWGERVGFMWSYWGLFGGVGVPMATWTYRVLTGLALVSLVGIAVYLTLKFRRDRHRFESWVPILLSGLWPLIVVNSLIRWANLTLASQGRLVFAAIAPLQLWFVAGLASSLPQRIGRFVAGGVVVLLAGLTVAAPFLWIAPAYAPPEPLAELPDGEVAALHIPGKGDATMRLLDYEVSPRTVEPGGSLEVMLTWQAEAPTAADWSVFIHVTDADEIIVAQRDTYPGLGALATSDLKPGYAWRDRTVIGIPETAYAPDEATVYAGFYNLQTGERMWIDGGEATLVELTGVSIAAPADAEVPNPVSFNFDDQMRLVGYQMSARTLTPGETLTLDLYWRGVQPMGIDYTVFTHIISPDTTIYGQLDSQPQGGSAPTSGWQVDELVEDQYQLTVREDTPPGVYQVEIGVYWVDEEGNIERLEHITEDGRRADNFILLSPVRVAP
jgi:4-amino-4-deoxy-L-arabinose transferase-like glycosyltransferase